ncbi:ribosomal oxygenase 1 isoform X2 [Anguilla anguilla]|uniref:ribosomal oxygenase 1 isoform X2 n=1 Tax=Anguilla anguilla TaxID=7936 RepID=UPI0015AEFC42|nr:ribosomal oxygenase 1 isoform X2 [Anguilla anguilla]
MENTHVSAFSIYERVLQQTPQPIEVAKKKKRKTHVQVSKSNNKAKRKHTGTPVLTDAQKMVGIEKPGVKEVSKVVKGPSLDTVLTGLAKINNSRERASKLFEWLIHPIPPKIFFRETWEKKPTLIKRQNPEYYNGLFSTAEFDRILRDDEVQFGVNLDVTSYINGKRETHHPPGRALPFTVWDFYKRGCSLRMLNPQAFSSTVWNVLSILQEQFNSMVGANMYLTPAGTQGFAPHYDDIEAFLVQLEGKKHWRVYNPRSDNEVLPLVSSRNFCQSEIGEKVLDVVLEAGDLLYFPRGFIHQGNCLPDAHSLHITISSYQRNSWGDLLQKLVPVALEMAMEEDVEFRRGLPTDYLTYMGVQNSDKADPRRSEFTARVKDLMRRLADFAPVDAAVDQKAKDFLYDCLPPLLTPEEKASSVHGALARWENGEAKDASIHLKGHTKIRLIRDGIARLTSDGDSILLCHTTDNSRVYHKEEPKNFEIRDEHTDAMEFLIHSYPKFVSVGSLPCDSFDNKAIHLLLSTTTTQPRPSSEPHYEQCKQ